MAVQYMSDNSDDKLIWEKSINEKKSIKENWLNKIDALKIV